MEASKSTINPTAVDRDLAFEQAFREHFKALHAYAFTIIKDGDDAEEIVQNVFVKLWERREQLGQIDSLKAYLYRATYNDSLNYLKHNKVKAAYETYAKATGSDRNDPVDTLSTRELQAKIDKALNELPEQCRTIFQMSRFEELKYREIADQLGLSVKTIENQMGKALKVLREKLADCLPLLFLFIFLTHK
ncbi:MAG: RNA polymerase sigma-70 factor [Flavipsychrobacter sp.]|nr:RNA polymerase sigma-70 factor [Flavipsychrobacter sp.]